MKSPSYLLPSSMSDPRSSMKSYYHRLDRLDVNTPDTVFVSSDIGEAADTILDEMKERGWNKAFLRSVHKAAPQRIKSGSIVCERKRSHIRSTLESLKIQLDNSVWDVGSNFVLREHLDLDFCMEPNHTMEHPEIRFFIESGEVLGRYPDQVSTDILCPRHYNHLEETIQSANPPLEDARSVAEEFQDYHWCVDFSLTTGGEWYCIEMNFGGLRWDGKRWRNMCGYGYEVAFSPEIIHSPVIKMDCFEKPEE